MFDVDEILSKLSIGQKIELLAGLGWWHTQPFPVAGVPSMRMSDGPNGVRGTRFFNGVPSSCFPSSTGLGSSFDIDLALRVGQALGDEAREKGCHILLAPTVNIQRSPLGGRGFESFSEDPHLNGTIAAAYINGVQSKGVSATIKHYVANDQEHQRFSISSDVSERALREIYLKPFQIAIKHSDPWALMTAYNRVNGTHVSESKWLIDDILRKEWGFKGMVMSDWIGVYSTSESIKAGLDLEMPGPTVMRGKAVERALIGEKLFPEDIEARARKILELLKRAHESGIPFNAPEKVHDTPGVRNLLRTASADAIVLLKNDKGILPLSSEGLKKIAVIGPNAKFAMFSGGGSARLRPTYLVSPLEGITSAAKEIGVDVGYTIGATSHRYLPLPTNYIKQENGDTGALVEFWNDPPSSRFLDTKSDPDQNLAPPSWSTPTHSTECILMDGIDESKVNEECWIRFSTKFIPDEDGDWDLDLSLAGRGNLFLDDKLLIDLTTNPKQGETTFGPGTVYARSVAEGLKAGRVYDLQVRISNAVFVAQELPFKFRGGLRVGAIRRVEENQAIKHAVELASESDVAILVIGLNNDWESEGHDRKNLDLPGLTNRLVTEVLKANQKTIIVNQSGTPVVMPWIDEAPTVLQAFYGGNELGNGLADVLFGKVNPSGKLALTFPKRLEDSPSYPSFGDKGQEYGKIAYNEGIFVGYRGYEIKNVPALFPFGHGLSYTTFEYSGIETTPISPEGLFSVSFTIQNTGNKDGREVAQIYVTDLDSSLPRPVKELKSFTKVALGVGESQKVKVDLDREALGFYDPKEKWLAEAGKFVVHVASSSAYIRLSAEVELAASFTWVGL